jgi:hypothetical protein
MPAAAASPQHDASAGPKWSARPLLRLVERLVACGHGLRARLTELAGAPRSDASARSRAGNVDPETIDQRLTMAIHRLIALLARIEMRIASRRGRARATAPGAREKRAEAARRRVEARKRWAEENRLDARYMPGPRGFCVPPPERPSAIQRYRKGLAGLIEGETDQEVLEQVAQELREIAWLLGEDIVAEAVDSAVDAAIAEVRRGHGFGFGWGKRGPDTG